MILEFDRRAFGPRGRFIVGLLVLLMSLFGLGSVGRAVTPKPARVLAWADWQAFKIERRYRAELKDLRAATTELAALVEAAPDPIRAGLLHDRLLASLAQGLPELEVRRAAVRAANDAVYQWAIAAQAREPAVLAVQSAIEALRQ